MTLEPLLQASPAIQVHTFAAVAALGLGAVVLFRRKGGRVHRLLGRTWVALMLVVALSSFFIHTIRTWGLWSPIHLLSISTILSLAVGVAMIRRRNVEAHRRIMRATFFGALVVAGIFTFLPGRIMHEVAFGPAPAVASPSARVAGVGLMDIIAGTPLWVWPLFGYLVYIGWMRTRDRVVEPWRLFVMPVVILALVLHNALSATSVGLSALLVCGAVVGALCGRAIGRRRPARLLEDGRLHIRGDWVPLVLMLAVFAVHYAEGVALALAPALAAGPVFMQASAFLYGFLALTMLARTLTQLPAGFFFRTLRSQPAR